MPCLGPRAAGVCSPRAVAGLGSELRHVPVCPFTLSSHAVPPWGCRTARFAFVPELFFRIVQGDCDRLPRDENLLERVLLIALS